MAKEIELKNTMKDFFFFSSGQPLSLQRVGSWHETLGLAFHYWYRLAKTTNGSKLADTGRQLFIHTIVNHNHNNANANRNIAPASRSLIQIKSIWKRKRRFQCEHSPGELAMYHLAHSPLSTNCFTLRLIVAFSLQISFFLVAASPIWPANSSAMNVSLGHDSTHTFPKKNSILSWKEIIFVKTKFSYLWRWATGDQNGWIGTPCQIEEK